ncbi:MAG TPA: hypothetical protein VGV87_24330, partial [Blastocatellia bacterium]|nr:hypothetical protein [Blastocatellia bacterium]
IIARFNGGALTEGASISGSVKAVNEDFFSEEAMSAIGQIPTPSPSASSSEDQPTVSIGALGSADASSALDYAPESDGSLAAAAVETEQELAHPKEMRRMRYDLILILALISFLLLAAATYFVYVYYVRTPAEPTPVETTT